MPDRFVDRSVQIFLASKAQILVNLVRQIVDPESVSDALAAVSAMQLKDSCPNRKQILDFIHRYEKSKNRGVDLKKQRLSSSMAVKLFRLHSATLWFNGCDHTKPPTSTPGTRLGRLLGPSRPISTADLARFQRAFYRYELYIHLFDSDLQSQGRRLFQNPSSTHFFPKKFDSREVKGLENVDTILRILIGELLDGFEYCSPERTGHSIFR